MKRYQRPLILMMLALALLYFTSPLIWVQAKSWVERYRTGDLLSQPGIITSSLVYPVKPGQWLTFNIPDGAHQIRVVSNAHIRESEQFDEDGWKYILHYQLLDDNEVILKDSLYYHHSKLTRYLDQEGKPVNGRFYAGYSLIPIDGRLMKLSMPVIQQASSIRISLVQQSMDVEEVALKLYVPAKFSEQSLASLWVRMSNLQKELLARNTAYPAALLTDFEKRNLVKHQWQPQGPVGIEGRDYRARTLYVRRELKQDIPVESMVASGLQIGAGFPGIIQIPEQGGQVQIKLIKLDGSPLDAPLDLQIEWFGRTREQRWERKVQWLAGMDALEYSAEGGLLQITATQPALVHVLLNTSGGQQIDITPTPLLITTYQASQEIDYQILHINHQPLPLRVDLRRIFDTNSHSGPVTIKYQWFNDQQRIVEQGELMITAGQSMYDRLTGKQKELPVSDPVRFYFNVPDEVSLIRFVSDDAGVLVNVYNQPDQFYKVQRIPESSYISLDKSNWFPSWFRMQPVNRETLVKRQAVTNIAAQYRPPANIDPALQADQYQWGDYKPLQAVEARSVLTVMNNTDYRDQALANVYCQLQPNQMNLVELSAYGNLPRITPKLISIRPDSSEFHLHVNSHQQQVLDIPAVGQQGIFSLSRLKAGQQRIDIRTDAGGQWYLNHVRNCKSQALLKKRVFKLGDKPLSFEISNEQRQDTIFTAQLYTPVHNQKRSVIQVSIEPLQKHPGEKIKEHWTFTRRIYDIRPADGEQTVVLYRHGYYLNAGQRFFIPFNSDMPEGRYRINVSLKKGEQGYLALSHINPGVFEQIRFYRETNDRDQ